MLEAGLGFAVKTGKGDFIGRDAVLRTQEAGLTRRLLQFRLSDPEPLLFHGEPILRDGRIVGHLTSGNYGHALGGAVGLGYVPCEETGEAPEIDARLGLCDRGSGSDLQRSGKPQTDVRSSVRTSEGVAGASQRHARSSGRRGPGSRGRVTRRRWRVIPAARPTNRHGGTVRGKRATTALALGRTGTAKERDEGQGAGILRPHAEFLALVLDPILRAQPRKKRVPVDLDVHIDHVQDVGLGQKLLEDLRAADHRDLRSASCRAEGARDVMG